VPPCAEEPFCALLCGQARVGLPQTKDGALLEAALRILAHASTWLAAPGCHYQVNKESVEWGLV
jgi:hypothetical protein